MPDISQSDPGPTSPPGSDRSVSGGVTISASATIGGDVVGRDKIVSIAGDNVSGDKIVSNTYTGDQQYDVHGLANPYMGLQSFTYADHIKYAGREKLIAETVARLTAPDDPLALLFVTGASGSGKSSFVQAGVLPALEKHYAALSVKWAVFRPSRDPLSALADALWRQLGLPPFDAYAASPADFDNFLRSNTPPQQVNVIVIDQFEELFTQGAAQPRDALFKLLTQPPPFRLTRTHIIATVRADYLPELFALPALYDVAKGGIDLRAMSVDELCDAIQQPLRSVHPDKDKRFQSELIERLAQDAAEDAAYLPLLQVTLEEIWRKGALTVGSYTNLADAIKQRADKVLAYQDYDAAQPDQPRSPEEQAAILNLCLDLVEVSLDDEARRDVRRRRLKSELISGTPERARLIDALTNARLLSVNTERDEPSHVEVDLIHETLLSNWDSLRQAIAERRHALRQRVRFEQQLKEWIRQTRSDDYLLSGVRLAEARELESRDDVALRVADAKDYVSRSVEREEARQKKELDDALRLAEAERLRAEEQTHSARQLRRRAIILAGALTVALAAVGLALVFGWRSNQSALEENLQRQQAEHQFALAQSRSLAFQSQIEANGSFPERSVLLALAALERYDYTPEAKNSLVNAIRSSRVRKILSKHSDKVIDVVWAADGTIITAGADGEVLFWNPVSASVTRHLPKSASAVLTIDISHDQHQLLVGNRDGDLSVWSAPFDKPNLVIHHDESVIDASWSPTGQQILSATQGKVYIWQSVGGGKVFEHSGLNPSWSPDGTEVIFADDNQVFVYQIGADLVRVDSDSIRENAVLRSGAWSPDGNEIAISSWSSVSIVDRNNFQTTAVITLEDIPVPGATSWSPDGRWIAILTEHNIALIDVHTLKVVQHRIPSQVLLQTSSVPKVWWSPTSTQFVVVGVGKFAYVVSTESPEQVMTLAGHASDVLSAAWTADGREIITVSADTTARIWTVVSHDNFLQQMSFGGHLDWIEKVAWSSDGSLLASLGRDGLIQIRDGHSMVLKQVLGQNAEYFYSMAWSPQANALLMVTDDNRLLEWQVSNIRELGKLEWDKHGIAAVQWSPDGERIGVLSNDGEFVIWNAFKPTNPSRLTATLQIRHFAWSSDSRRIAVVSGGRGLQVWDVATVTKVSESLPDANIDNVIWSPGSDLLTVSGSGMSLWHGDTGNKLIDLSGQTSQIEAVDYSHDGRYVASAGRDGTVRIWDVNGQQLRILAGHETTVKSVSWSPNGESLATLGDDNTIRVWDFDTGIELVELGGDVGTIMSVEWSPLGNYIASGGRDKLVRVWNIWQTPTELIRLAKECCVVRQLTQPELVQFQVIQQP